MILSTALIEVMLAVVTHLKVLVAYHCEALFLVHIAVESACSRLVDNFLFLGGRVIQGSKLLPSSDASVLAGGRGRCMGEAHLFLTAPTQMLPPYPACIPLVRTSHVAPPRHRVAPEMKFWMGSHFPVTVH